MQPVLAPLALPAHKDLQDRLAVQDLWVLQAAQDHKAHKDHKVLLDHKDHKALQAQLGQQDHKDQLELPAYKDHKALQGHPVQYLDHKDHKDQADHKDHKDHQAPTHCLMLHRNLVVHQHFIQYLYKPQV